MLTHPTLDQLRTLKLDGMAQAFVELEAQEEARNLEHAEWLALLLDRETANRDTRRGQGLQSEYAAQKNNLSRNVLPHS
jgi:DNA replication protein DnaC